MANSDNEQSFLEGVINYVDPMGFHGGKERIRIPIKSKHSSLEVLKRSSIEYTGLKAESEKRGLLRIPDWNKTPLGKSAEGSLEYAINNDDNIDEWIFENSLETWTRTRIFIHRDALFLLFKFCDTCVGPPFFTPPPNPPHNTLYSL